MKSQKKSYTLSEAIVKLEGYCAYQERCHQEVRSKLLKMHMIPEAIDRVITHLIQEDFLNEERFSRAFARGKHHIKKWGRRRIVSELKQRNISKFNINSALDEIDEEAYLSTFDALSDKRLAQIQGESLQKKRKKLANYLLYRG
ncbi:MAG: RecX family transcriptional regulator, partial [Eudoraea sp.]|nr:RecX family transcriptional regulator [Eudoraea sp.]